MCECANEKVVQSCSRAVMQSCSCSQNRSAVLQFYCYHFQGNIEDVPP